MMHDHRRRLINDALALTTDAEAKVAVLVVAGEITLIETTQRAE